MRERAAERGIGRAEHLRRLEALFMALQERANVTRNVIRTKLAVNIIGASCAKGIHQRLITALTDGDHRNVGGLEINIQDARNIVRAQLSEICSAKDRSRHIPLEHGKRISGLRTVNHLEAFLL